MAKSQLKIVQQGSAINITCTQARVLRDVKCYIIGYLYNSGSRYGLCIMWTGLRCTCADGIPPSPEELGNNQMSPLWWGIYSPPPPGISCPYTQDDNILSLPWWTSSVKEEGLCLVGTRKSGMKVWWQTADPEQKGTRRWCQSQEISTKTSIVGITYEEEPLACFIYGVVQIWSNFHLKNCTLSNRNKNEASTQQIN